MATIQDLGKVAYFNKGMYNSETNYEINDVVSYNGSSYVSLLNNNQGNLPTNATYWSVVALKGDKGDTGKPFVIEKTYESIEDMVADYDNMQVNDYVMIQGNIEEEENATLWTKTETEVSPYKWVYLADFSGASGITGATPNIQIGTVTEGNEPAVTRRAGSSNENPILDFVLKTGATGQTGATGNGISSVSKTSTSGLTDTYTIEYTSGNSTTYNVTNGKGIASVTKTGSSGLIDTYTITYNDGTTSTYTITNGEDGEVTQEQLDETNSEIELVRKIYNAFPTTSDEDESITLNGTAEVQFKNFELKGNTSQNTTTGKNLLNSSTITTGINNGITCTYDSLNQEITFNGTCNTDNTSFPFNNTSISAIASNTTVSVYYVSGTLTNYGSVRFFNKNYGGNVNIDLTALNNNQKIASVTSDLTQNLVNNYVRFNNGSIANNFKIKVMVANSTDATYEPFTNGASPNPDYPQDVQVVSGDNTIKVEGKNLCNGITQNYYVNQVATRCGYAVGDSGLIIEVDGASDYTISSNTVQTRYRVGCLNEIPVEGGSNAIVYNGSNKDGTDDSVTINTNGYKYLVVNATDLTSIQIEKESSASEFQPYQSQSYTVNLGNIELCKIGDYQDSIVKDNGKWYKHKEFNKVVLNGTETWRGGKAGTTSTDYIYLYTSVPKSDTNRVATIKCNYLKVDIVHGGSETSVSVVGVSTTDSDNLRCLIDKTLINNPTTDSEAKTNWATWLSTHNTIVYYPLATPTITEITDTTLIEQLDNLENAYSYDTQTNITQTNDDMPFILDVEALMSLKGVLN